MNEKALFNLLHTALKDKRELYYTPAKITKIFRDTLGTDDIMFKTVRNGDIEPGDVIVSGEYDKIDDEENFSSITIYVGFHPNDTLIRIGDLNLKQLAIAVIECIGHEQIQQKRYRDRDFDVDPTIFISGVQDDEDWQEQQYLGQPDKVEAYGYSIACELFLRHRAKILTGQHLYKTLMYRVYASQFGEKHPIVNQLISNTLKYYSKMSGENCGKVARQKVPNAV